MTPRLDPVQPPYDEGTADTLRRLMGGVDAEPLALFRTIAHHDVLLERFRQLGSTLLSFGRLPAADRETVIHRVTARCGAEYEWGVHAVAFAGPLGLDEAWLAATVHARPADVEDERTALIFAVVDELHDIGTLSEATWVGARAVYADDQLVELVCLVGFYHLVSFVCRAFEVEREPWAARFPAGA